MRLYYLTPQIWAETILREQRFKLCTVDETNDPFELLGASVGKKQARKAYGILRDHWAKNVGMLCTSRSWESPVMWAHYGDRHRGVCLGFDVTEAEVHQVRYQARKLSGLLDHIGSGPMLEEQLTAILTTKFKDWEYEREWRVFARLDEREPKNGLYYLNFNPHFTLREVILGARCSATPQEFAQHVVPSKGRVEIVKARPAFQSFRIVRQLRVPSIVIPPIAGMG